MYRVVGMSEYDAVYGDDSDSRREAQRLADMDRTRMEENLALAEEEFARETGTWDDADYLELTEQMDRLGAELVAETLEAQGIEESQETPAPAAQPATFKARLAAKLTETAARLDPDVTARPADDPYPSISAEIDRHQQAASQAGEGRQELFEQVSAAGRQKAERIAVVGRAVGTAAKTKARDWAQKARQAVDDQLGDLAQEASSASERMKPVADSAPGAKLWPAGAGVPLSQWYQGNAPRESDGPEADLSR